MTETSILSAKLNPLRQDEELEDEDYLSYYQPSSFAMRQIAAAGPPDLQEIKQLRSERISAMDPVGMRKMIFDEVLRTARRHPGIANDRYLLRITDPHYVHPKEYTSDDELKAILGGGTLAWGLAGTWELVDRATGKTVDRKQAIIARVPYLTNRGTFVYNGSDYALSSQWRLRPAIFTRRRQTGEIESHVNVLPAEGVSHRLVLDPRTGIFKVLVRQAELPAYPLLRAMGATDEELEQVIGKELLEANRKARGTHTEILKKLRSQLVLRSVDEKSLPDDEMLRKALSSIRLDGLATRHLLGVDTRRLGKEAYLAALARMKYASQLPEEEEFDDRDQLAFQRLYTPAQLIAERLQRDYGHMQQELLRKVTYEGNLSKLRSGSLTRQLFDAILASGLGNNLEETNAAEVLDRRMRTTRLGEGGVGSVEAFPEEARAFQISYAGYLDPVKTPETLRAGVDLVLASGVKVDRLGNIYAPMQNVRTGRLEYITPRQLVGMTVTSMDEWKDPSRKMVRAIRGNRLTYVPRRQVDYLIPSGEKIFSPLSNLVPMKSAVFGQRISMGARMISQALPLRQGEAPLVQSLDPESGQSYEQLFGRSLGGHQAEGNGVVTQVTPQSITVRYESGEKKTYPLYSNFPLNRRTLWNHVPTVKRGDVVRKGQLLARANFTDEEGTLALGRNLKVGYLAAKGFNFEDGIVISQSAARKLTSEHMHQHTLEVDPMIRMGKASYLGIFPQRFDRRQLQMLDNEGVIQPGQIVQPGDPLILAFERQLMPGQKQRSRRKSTWRDRSVVWDSDVPGEVVHVHRNPRTNVVNVVVRSWRPVEVGDKLSGRFGDKGVVAAIWPDDKMPVDENGEPLEVLLDPLGVQTRKNPAQIYEAVLSELAHRRGKPYVIEDFADIKDLARFVESERRRYGVEDLQDVTDPETGNKIGKVLVGRRWMMRLHHLAEEKEQGRSVRGQYSIDEIPAKGGEEGAMRLGLLNTFALLSHGAIDFMRGSALTRGQRNEDFWLAMMAGHAPPPPRVPLIFRKFVASLRAAGINVAAKGPKLNIFAMTAGDIEKLTEGRVISSPETLHYSKNMEPAPGGLFDVRLTGGPGGSRWAAIKLSEPVINPVMEEPIARILNVTPRQLEQIIAGKEKLPDGSWGLRGIAAALEKIDLKEELNKAKQQLRSNSASARAQALRKLRYLEIMHARGMHPKDWIWHKVPVLPPIFRPISEAATSRRMVLVADVNYLYKALMESDRNLIDLRKQVGYEGTGDEQLQLYRTVKAVTGLAEPPQRELRDKKVKGILAHVFGSSAKYGYMQQRLLSSTVDLVGRAVIAPDPRLDMDSIALPEEKAWKVYEPFIMRHLRRRGISMAQALQEIKNRSPMARSALLEEMSQRPVIVDRHPVWHKFGMLAFYPQLTADRTIKVSPLIVRGFNADFDGDTMSFHVPVTDEELEEVKERMLPSRNLISPADFKRPVHVPSQQYVLGLYYGTRAAPRQGRRQLVRSVFSSIKELEAALKRGDVKPWEEVVVRSG